MTRCGNKITKNALLLWLSAIGIGKWPGFLFLFIFLIAKFINLYLPFCLKCLSGSLQIAQRWGEVLHEEKRGKEHTISKYECLLPVIVNTTLFIHVYTPARHIRTPYFHCTQGERVIIVLIELLAKMGLQEKLFIQGVQVMAEMAGRSINKKRGSSR